MYLESLAVEPTSNCCATARGSQKGARSGTSMRQQPKRCKVPDIFPRRSPSHRHLSKSLQPCTCRVGWPPHFTPQGSLRQCWFCVPALQLLKNFLGKPPAFASTTLQSFHWQTADLQAFGSRGMMSEHTFEIQSLRLSRLSCQSSVSDVDLNTTAASFASLLHPSTTAAGFSANLSQPLHGLQSCQVPNIFSADSSSRPRPPRSAQAGMMFHTSRLPGNRLRMARTPAECWGSLTKLQSSGHLSGRLHKPPSPPYPQPIVCRVEHNPLKVAAWSGKRLYSACAPGRCSFYVCMRALEFSERLPRETASVCRHSSAKFLPPGKGHDGPAAPNQSTAWCCE